MMQADVARRAFAMPLTNPAYPVGPCRLRNREFLSATHIIADVTLGLRQVVHDHLPERT
jgi:acetoacetate decarboxylase